MGNAYSSVADGKTVPRGHYVKRIDGCIFIFHVIVIPIASYACAFIIGKWLSQYAFRLVGSLIVIQFVHRICA